MLIMMSSSTLVPGVGVPKLIVQDTTQLARLLNRLINNVGMFALERKYNVIKLYFSSPSDKW